MRSTFYLYDFQFLFDNSFFRKVKKHDLSFMQSRDYGASK
jgi:hypothetical protein